MDCVTELTELCELKGMIKEHSIDCDYPDVFRILEKLDFIIEQKKELIIEENRALQYALHNCKQANKMHCEQLREIKKEVE